MSIPWLPYEWRILGIGANLGPLLAVMGCAFIAGMMYIGGASNEQIQDVLSSGLELGVPLVGGIMTASIITSDRADELQRSVRTRYRTTLTRRVGIALTWSAALAILTSVILEATGYWVVPQVFIVSQLSWVAPLLWFTGAATMLAAILRSWAGVVSLLGGIWVIQNGAEDWFLSRAWTRPFFLFMTTHEPTAGDWTSTRLVVAVTGLILCLLGILIHARSEPTAMGED